MDYDELLERASKNMPERTEEATRFEVPKVKGHIEGNKTVISNFKQMADALGRSAEHLLKYVLKELATPGELRKDAAIMGTKISASRVNEKIEQYVKDFVLCPACKKPDTKLVKEAKIMFIKCSACGAKQSVELKMQK